MGKNNNGQMVTYITVEITGIMTYKLSALIDDNGNYIMPSLDIRGHNEITSWDNEKYLTGDLYQIIKIFNEGKVTLIATEFKEKYDEIRQFIPVNDFPLVEKLLNQGKDLNII